MTAVDTRPPTAPWNPRVSAQLAVLSAAAFVYVTAEVVPVSALPAIAADLNVSEGRVGTLLAGYALIAALTTIPLVRLTARWPRRRTLLLTLVCLTISQVVSAAAPNFAVLAGGRVLCALTHGLMWSVIAPIGARLVPASHAGRATTAVYAGTALALVLGTPLTAAASQLWGWRVAVAAIAVAAAAVTVAAATALPPMRSCGDTAVAPHRRLWPLNRRLVTLSLLTVIGVTGHFISYTFIVVIIRDVVGLSGAHLGWLLGAFGLAGLFAMAGMARPLDLRPKPSALICLAVLAGALGTLSLLAARGGAGTATTVIGVLAVVVWGASSTALPPMLQAAAMRTAPDDPDSASGLYVAGFQVGITAGALCGAVLSGWAGPTGLTAVSAALIAVALTCVIRARGLFDVACELGRK